MRKYVGLALGMVLASGISAAAQNHHASDRSAEKLHAPTPDPAAKQQPIPSAAFPSVRPLQEQPALFQGPLGADYSRDHASQFFSSLRVVKNPFVREVRLGFAQFWSGRLQLGGFGSTRRMDNALHTSSGWGSFPGTRAGALDYSNLRTLGTERTYGLTMTFRLGRDVATGRRAEACRCFGWVAAWLR